MIDLKTVFTTAQSGMWITPHNHLLSDPSRQSKQMIHIDLDEDGVASDVTTYGQEEADGVVDLVSAAPFRRGGG
jgi:primary-amine oxidase